MKRLVKLLFVFTVFFSGFTIYSCGGGGGSGNDGSQTPVSSQTATVSGTISAIQGQSISALAVNNPVNVVAIDNDFNMEKTTTDQNGKFSLKLTKGKSYAFLFQGTDGAFLGSLIVNNYSGLQIDSDLDLGSITIDKTNKVAKTNKEQELASKISQNLNIKKPEDIKVDPTKTKKIDLSLFLSNKKAWVRFGFNSKTKQFHIHINKTIPYNGYLIEVGYSFRGGLKNSNGQFCKINNDLFDVKCYKITSYIKEQFLAGKYKKIFNCELGQSWQGKPSKFQIPYLLEVGKSFAIGNGITVQLVKVASGITFNNTTLKTNVKNTNKINAALFKLGSKYYWLVSGYGDFIVTSSDNTSTPNLIWDMSQPKNATDYLYAVVNKNNQVLYAGKGSNLKLPSNYETKLINLINSLPTPNFSNLPHACAGIIQ